MVLSGISLLAVILYVFAINFTVRNVVKREAMEQELSRISMHISELEFKYIHLKNSITLDYAQKLGFVPTKETKYVSRKTSVAMADFAASQDGFETR